MLYWNMVCFCSRRRLSSPSLSLRLWLSLATLCCCHRKAAFSLCAAPCLGLPLVFFSLHSHLSLACVFCIMGFWTNIKQDSLLQISNINPWQTLGPIHINKWLPLLLVEHFWINVWVNKQKHSICLGLINFLFTDTEFLLGCSIVPVLWLLHTQHRYSRSLSSEKSMMLEKKERKKTQKDFFLLERI